MHPIKLNNGTELSQQDFTKYLLNLCENQRKDGQALVFAFLVYDFENNTICEILEHRNYWLALDKISGKFLSIFYINSNDDYFHRKQNEIRKEEEKKQRHFSDKGYLSDLIPIQIKETPLEKTIKFLKKTFGISDYIKHPFIIFFQIADEKIIGSFVVTLKEERLEESFLELKNIIKNATDSLSTLKPENLTNYQSIFNIIEDGVKNGELVKFVKTKIIPKFSAVVTLVKTVLAGF